MLFIVFACGAWGCFFSAVVEYTKYQSVLWGIFFFFGGGKRIGDVAFASRSQLSVVDFFQTCTSQYDLYLFFVKRETSGFFFLV